MNNKTTSTQPVSEAVTWYPPYIIKGFGTENNQIAALLRWDVKGPDRASSDLDAIVSLIANALETFTKQSPEIAVRPWESRNSTAEAVRATNVSVGQIWTDAD